MGFLDGFRGGAGGSSDGADDRGSGPPPDGYEPLPLPPGEKRQKPLRSGAPRSMTASGQKMNVKSPADIAALRNRVYMTWQNDAWAFYDAIGEVKYALNMMANVISRIRLYPALDLDPDAVPTSVDTYRAKLREQSQEERADDAGTGASAPPAVTSEVLDYMTDLLKDLATGTGGMSSFMRSFSLNVSVAGECFLLNYKGRWYIKSSSELMVSQAGKIILRTRRAGPSTATTTSGTVIGDIELPPKTFFARIWREHPRYSGEPDSSMMSLREMCDELLILQRMIRTIARSRMNAGMLAIPDGLSAAGSTVAEDVATAEETLDELVNALYESITAPISDETNAASQVPTVVTGPGDAIAQIKYLTFERPFDETIMKRMQDVLERILGGLDVPKDMVQGMAGMRYANARTMNEHMYQSQVEPTVLMLCDALTASYFRPALAKKFPDLTDADLLSLCVWYDPSEVVTNSDPSVAADKGLDAFTVSAASWRKAHGFSENDAPTEQELALRYFLNKVAAQPDDVETLFKWAFPAMTEQERQKNIAQMPVPFPASAADILDGGDGTGTAPQPQVPGDSADVSQQQWDSEEQNSGTYTGGSGASPDLGDGTAGGGPAQPPPDIAEW